MPRTPFACCFATCQPSLSLDILLRRSRTLNGEFHVRYHYDTTSSAAGVSGSYHTHRLHRPTSQNNSPTAATPAPVNMPRWQPAPFGGAVPAAVAAPAPAPAANNPWTNPSHPTARAAMGLATVAAPVAIPNTGHHHRWHTAPVAVAAAPHVGHHRRWHPAPVAAAAAPIQYVQWPVAALPNNSWNHFATHPYYGAYSWVVPSSIACVLACIAAYSSLHSLMSLHRRSQHRFTSRVVVGMSNSTPVDYKTLDLPTSQPRMAGG